MARHRIGRLVPLALLAVLTGCGAEFDPASWLRETRVLAIEAAPLDVVGDAEVTLVVRVFVPEGTAVVRERWSVCPLTMGPEGGFACVDAACETEIEPEADGTVRTRPRPLLLACVGDLTTDAGEGRTAAPFDPDELPESVDVVFRYEVEDDTGLERRSILRLPVWLGDGPAAPNRPPVITAVTFAGVPAATGDPVAAVAEDGRLEVGVLVDAESLDAYEDVDGTDLVEEPIVSFFATAGRFDRQQKAGADVTTTWTAKELADGDSAATFWVLVLDLRGGQAVAGPFLVPIERAADDAAAGGDDDGGDGDGGT